MLLTPRTPAKSLDPAYKLRPGREQIERFKACYLHLFGHINEKESEENVKDHLMDFLKEVYYRDSYVVAPKGRTDFVIHLGREAGSPAGVLFEVKRPANKSEMVSRDNLNVKAFHELLLYYFQERSRDRNSDLRHCVITNVYEWYIFDAALIDRVFYRNAHLKKEYAAWASGQKVSRNNDLFYNEILKPFLAGLDEEITFTYFDLRDYHRNVADHDPTNDRALLPLYKVLSPVHLLKLPAATDSNRLNPRFYSELLHLIGLEEVKEGNKKVIRRKAPERREEGSLLENTIIELETADKLAHLPDPAQYGPTDGERLFNVALELCITWVNRVLFLKLLESQLVQYHRGSRDYAFLNHDTISDYDELYKLFFRVLAKRPAERRDSIQRKFSKVPYLNSSLFEITELEDHTLSINGLDDSLSLPLLRNSVLTDHPAYRHRPELPTLQYLFAFLDAYDFASEVGDDIQEQNRPLINASVLGLIFEKINGYRDGSFYTPGFITEYMCRETIRKAVVQRFNERYGWQCADFGALQDKDLNRDEANALLNGLRICDPAVGSGHFLVSALNELLAIKCDLGILQDTEGRRLKGYQVRVLNDELVVLDEDDEPVQYQLSTNASRPSVARPSTERQRVQRTLFHEKQVLIENCLFGVDINPNSVKICRLRLWIELLKNAYYTEESGFAELETLPNIDINIKQGNSLLSKFSLTEDLSEVFRRQKFSMQTYKDTVAAYKKTADKEAKAELLRFINDIKGQFRETVYRQDPRRKRLSAKRGERILLDNNVDIFGKPLKDPKLVATEKKRLGKLIEQLEDEIAEVENNSLYRNSFEWRFEFPEVLDEAGNYRGFDVVIGNPPYVFARENFSDTSKIYYNNNFKAAQYQVNLYLLFIEQAILLLKSDGLVSYIIPNSFLMVSSASEIRKFLLEKCSLNFVVNLLGETFDGVSVETVIIGAERNINKVDSTVKIYTGDLNKIIYSHSKEQLYFSTKSNSEINIFSNTDDDNIKTKLWKGSVDLQEIVQIRAGLMAYEVGKGVPKQSLEDVKNRIYDFDFKFDDTTFKYIEGKDVKRYFIKWSGTYLKYGNNLASPRSFDLFNGEKIIIREITGKHPNSIISVYSQDTFLFNRSNIGILPIENSEICLKYVLSILNSKVMSYYFMTNTAKSVRKMFPKLILQDLRLFPFKKIEKIEQMPFINLVNQILNAKGTDPTADTTAQEAEIDRLVYELYGLTEEEIALVEGT